ncbi:MAG: DUF5702 domain-containing protein [Clostridiales bacterium]|nr:DUF5702 domain-containing protein [Clostridiales bacterium]
MLVASVLLTLLEAARVRQMELMADVVTDSATESIFAAYDTVLWEQYHLLLRSASLANGAVSMGDVESELKELADTAMDPTGRTISVSNNDLLRAQTQSIMVSGYTLITDEKGAVFRAAVCSYMENNIGYESAKTIMEKLEEGESLEEMDVDAAIEEAQEGIEQAKSEASESSGETNGESGTGATGGSEGNEGVEATSVVSDDENPLEIIKKIRKMGLLTLLVEDVSEVSDKSITLSETIAKRTLNTGTESLVSTDEDWYQKILVTQYYAEYYSNYLKPNDENALSYEQEYIICGKSSDIENLKGCINRILLIREAANLICLMQDAAKVSQAYSLAISLAGVSANPVIIEAVKYGILVAWAYAESLLDVRALLQGDKIALVKTSEQWTTSMTGLSQCASGDFKAINCSNGLTYSEYLNLLLYTAGNKAAAYRAMDLQELYIRQQDGYEDFLMDQMFVAIRVSATYEFSANFLPLVTLVSFSQTEFTVSSESVYSYLEP